MAALSAARVNPGRALLKVGVDFAGAFLITPQRGRGVEAIKLLDCIFVYFTTKANHLELSSDLSTQKCIAVLKRFITWRGKPKEIFSDCGTNFIGAKNFLRSWELETTGHYFSNEGIKWTMNVPSAPHF
ncbi:uncharacterized protein NPIL_574411 [Nephila pilipes]|uniref:Integrase catalytic domain-containing protein n=1 Tax=Nephila pilipes TaxID=299642 RepID=A0A8X6NDN9_NEPPI|nr:uncharacterized protein NPIL_574411 [Nephila pilipes]